MSIIEHILLFSLLFIVYAFWGKNNANKSGAAFWTAAVVPILLYVFIVGSRYGWGVDYPWYRFQFENVEYIKDQIVFKWLNQFLNFIGFNYVGGFMVYAFIFITCAFVFLRSYGEPSKYMYCFLVPAILIISTSFIRQGVGLAFIFLALVFFYQQKWLLMAFATIIAFQIHSATILTLLPILGIFFFLKKPIHYWLSIPLYLFFAFVFDVEKMSFIVELLSNNISFDNKFQSYINNSERWFGTGAIKVNWMQSTFALIMSSLFYISLFYLGYQALKIRANKQVLCMYNTVVFGVIFLRAAFLYEILRRIADAWVMFYFVPLGYIIYVYFQDCKQPETHYAILLRRYYPMGITMILAYLLMWWGRFVFQNPDADFFWYHLHEYLDPRILPQW